MKLWLTTFAAIALACAASAAAHPDAFVAHYALTRGGKTIGRATMTLSHGDDGWVFATRSRATSGPASWLGFDVDERSNFRWRGDDPEAIGYDYRLDSGIKKASRKLRVDWRGKRVTVDDSRHGVAHYAAQPKLVERHLASLALAAALARGASSVTLAVAVRDRVETQHYRVANRGAVTVPAGHFAHAVELERGDEQRDFRAWFVPAKFPVPVKLTVGHRFELELVDYSAAR